MKVYALFIGAAASIMAAGAASLFPAYVSARPGPPIGVGFDFLGSHDRPSAGRLFTGVVVVNRDPARVAIRRISCDAQIGSERLRGRQRRYFVPLYKDAADIACSWRIPADARGETLRLWKYRLGRRVGVFASSGLVADSHTFSWRVKR